MCKRNWKVSSREISRNSGQAVFIAYSPIAWVVGSVPWVASTNMCCGYLIFIQRECEELVHILVNDHIAIHHDNPLYSVNGLVDAPLQFGAAQTDLVLCLLKDSANRGDHISRVTGGSEGSTHLSLVQVSLNRVSVTEGSYCSRAGPSVSMSISVIPSFLMMALAS